MRPGATVRQVVVRETSADVPLSVQSRPTQPTGTTCMHRAVQGRGAKHVPSCWDCMRERTPLERSSLQTRPQSAQPNPFSRTSVASPCSWCASSPACSSGGVLERGGVCGALCAAVASSPFEKDCALLRAAGIAKEGPCKFTRPRDKHHHLVCAGAAIEQAVVRRTKVLRSHLFLLPPSHGRDVFGLHARQRYADSTEKVVHLCVPATSADWSSLRSSHALLWVSEV
jgi:hypothetical protein